MLVAMVSYLAGGGKVPRAISAGGGKLPMMAQALRWCRRVTDKLRSTAVLQGKERWSRGSSKSRSELTS